MIKKMGIKFNLGCKKIIAVFLAIIIFTCINTTEANAVTIATLNRDSTTFTGTNVYTGVSGPMGYYTLTIKSNRISDRLYEDVTLKSSGGVNRPSIIASGYNTSSVSTKTSNFADGYYTMKGYYYYTVTSYLGNDYTFSVTY